MGEIASLITAICWALTSIFFSTAGKQVGSLVVNRTRLVLAVIWLMLTHLALQGTILPVHATIDHWLWLGLSGIIGLVIGDALLFQAYVQIGPRITTLIMAIVPVISAVLAWGLLGEALNLIEITGICITVAGIAWVVSEKTSDASNHDGHAHFTGILYALGGAMGQAFGLVLSKRGLSDNFPSISGVLIRMIVAMLVMWGITMLQGQIGSTVKSIRNNMPAMKSIIAGSVVGPFIGVWLSLVAVQLSPVGVASTLMALTPIMLLPFSHYVLKEKISLRAVAGTIGAITGVAIIFLVA